MTPALEPPERAAPSPTEGWPIPEGDRADGRTLRRPMAAGVLRGRDPRHADGEPGSTACPACGTGTVDGAGLYACPACDWTGILE